MDDAALSTPRSPPLNVSADAGTRLQAIDLLRGIVIVLMALDHVRDFFHADAFLFDPLDLDKTSVVLYLTRWITHLCAPTFVLLAGVSAYLHGVNVASRPALSSFLLTRGLWLIVLETTVVAFAWSFGGGEVTLQVIWALGVAMIVLAVLVWLPHRAVLLVGVLVVAGHNAFDGLAVADAGDWGTAWMLLQAGGDLRPVTGLGAWVLYPALPWMGVMAMGYGLGPVFRLEATERRRILTALGLTMIVGFFVLRGLQVYGDPHPWSMHAQLLATAGDFFSTHKYPPSLLYLLMTLGPVFVLLPRLEQCKEPKGPVGSCFLTFGRVPLFFYVLHLYLVHGLMLLVAMALGHPASFAIDILSQSHAVVAQGWGFSLPVVYAVWLLVLALLYPACRRFGALKRERRAWWLSYL
jgi:uncharacterized membrane protein